MATITRVCRSALRPHNSRLIGANLTRIAGISTSKKNKDTISLSDEVIQKEKVDTQENTAVTNKNWISWGFSYESEVKDNTTMHMTFFASVTLCIVTGGFVWAYMPDFRMIDWAQREAYLQLRQREAEGLPLIDPNVVDPEKFELPEDEELGGVEIII
ncbi:NADH dehydrogenase [ubiquinone] 1 beta subcomplex subunit 11, mitochondrial [Panulirus ornatus]|uniref:NADH dehydrogenase [ubiquinone] 1 beta subcomplex subunit 11, mitochondrial n=1 Tax=Panulirus ornatus TaxID=150431 RepID=UPI003A876CA0